MIVLARIDARLLHGLVANQWVPYSRCNRVMVIDDIIAKNPTLKNAMRLAKPVGVSLSIITEEQAIHNFLSGKYEKQKILVLSKSAKTILNLLHQNISVLKLNIGSTDPSIRGIKVSKQAQLSSEEVGYLKQIRNFKVPVYVRYALLYSEIPLSNFF